MTHSGFDLGLGDADQSGVYFVAPSDLDTLGAAGRDAGLLVRRVDLACEGKNALMLRFAMQLEFPDSTGRNWDALSDRLRDLAWLPAAAGYVLLLDDAARLRARDAASFDTLLDVLNEASAFWVQQDRPFWAFVALDEEDQD